MMWVDDCSCNEGTACKGEGVECVYSQQGVTTGVCEPVPEVPCWRDDDCEFGSICAGQSVCPCGYDCDAADQPGTCVKATGGECCTGGDCQAGSVCLDLPSGSTCHNTVEAPRCWTSADCAGGECQGAMLCSCTQDCMSRPGTCFLDE